MRAAKDTRVGSITSREVQEMAILLDIPQNVWPLTLTCLVQADCLSGNKGHPATGAMSCQPLAACA